MKEKRGFMCDECEGNFKSTRHIRFFKNRALCTRCFFKLNKDKMIFNLPKTVLLKDVLEKERIVKIHNTKNPSGYLYLPRCCIGKKVKLVLVK